jgi:hypothetical protein
LGDRDDGLVCDEIQGLSLASFQSWPVASQILRRKREKS